MKSCRSLSFGDEKHHGRGSETKGAAKGVGTWGGVGGKAEENDKNKDGAVGSDRL